MMPKNLILFLIALTVFSFVVRIYRVTEPDHYYFDEVYHVVTARAYANNNPAAYDPFSPPPEEGTAYDWLHPPLAKLVQAGSIKIFGDDPFSWRLPSVIFGTALIPATFILAFLMFGPTVAIFASSVIAFENLTLVMSRITMNDIFLTFFVVCSFIFANLYILKRSYKNFILAAIFLGFAVATKWPGIYAIAAVLAYISFKDFKEKKLHPKLTLLILIPVFIYISSYGQYFFQGYTVNEFIGLHKQIWWYQNRADLSHFYGTTPLYCVPEGLDSKKEWCPWVLGIRGVYFSYEDYGVGKAGYIYALGNPIIFWLGLVAASYVAVKMIQKKSTKIAFLLLGYFIFWIPWIFTPRLLFLYHYLPAIPFLAIILGYEMRDVFNTRFKYAAYFLMVIIILAFFYFYPVSTGWPIQVESIERFMWLKSWR